MQDDKIVRMELKYCECCGGLLLRQAGTDATYCGGCAARVREMAAPRAKRRGRQPKAAAVAKLANSSGDPTPMETGGQDQSGAGLEMPRLEGEDFSGDIEAACAPLLPLLASLTAFGEAGRPA